MENFLTEKEYCLVNRNDFFSSLDNKKVAIYGTGINAKTIVGAFNKENVVCFVDDNKAGQYFEGFYVASMTEFLRMGVKTLILAAQIDSAISIYYRIEEKCNSYGIDVYEMHGKNMCELVGARWTMKTEFASESMKTLEEKIDSYDIVSISFVDSIVTPTIPLEWIWNDVENKLRDLGLFIDNLYSQVLKFNSSELSLFDKLVNVCKSNGFTDEQIDTAKKALVVTFLRYFLPRETVIRLLNNAVSKGKKVFIIEDSRDYKLHSDEIKYLLELVGFNDVSSINVITDNKIDKIHGLYRKAFSSDDFAKTIHIGCSINRDFYMPRLYGIESVNILRTDDLISKFSVLPKINEESLNNIKGQYTDFIRRNKVFYTDFLIPGTGETKYLEQLCFDTTDYCDTDFNGFHPKLFSLRCPDAYVPISVPEVKDPLVSIVIPVYNQFSYTYLCIKSIVENSGDIPYEIIIADDCSTDDTKKISELISGLTLIRNKENLRFLKNCNNAAKSAKGKYILFLNNDTQVQPNWLKPLAELIESKEDIGMVGSKLVYPDGSLQEAGGILWKDGSAWNFGHGSNAMLAQFNYVKEADYISGASIMIKHDLWKEIGGFDDNFAPAYCEDSDLAFEVRKHGQKVMFQPKSVVVHFEGKSNGTDISCGQKAYQVINNKKLVEKWKSVLEKKHAENGFDVFHARDKSFGKKTVLFIDHYVPTFDKDAGSKTTYQYLKLFVEKGYNVKFIGDNFAYMYPYSDVLKQMGIEVLDGPWYAEHWQDWILENRNNIDFAFLERPHITCKYIDFIKINTNIKCCYYGHDLHFFRLRREYELSGNIVKLVESEECKLIEFSILDKAECSFYPSEIECDEIHKVNPDVNVKALLAYMYDDVDVNMKYSFDNRNGIMFIGGFSHTPNVDAVLWFAKEIFPKIDSSLGIKFYVAGSNPPKEILALNSDKIIVKGFVTDNELKELYLNSRISIAPLRYGSGIKGKNIEAMKFGIPLVTTSIGAEGIDGIQDVAVVEDDAETIAKIISDLYNDKERLEKMSMDSRIFISKNFSSEAAWNSIREEFE